MEAYGAEICEQKWIVEENKSYRERGGEMESDMATLMMATMVTTTMTMTTATK